LERASEPTLHSPGGEAIPDAFALVVPLARPRLALLGHAGVFVSFWSPSASPPAWGHEVGDAATDSPAKRNHERHRHDKLACGNDKRDVRPYPKPELGQAPSTLRSHPQPMSPAAGRPHQLGRVGAHRSRSPQPGRRPRSYARARRPACVLTPRPAPTIVRQAASASPTSPCEAGGLRSSTVPKAAGEASRGDGAHPPLRPPHQAHLQPESRLQPVVPHTKWRGCAAAWCRRQLRQQQGGETQRHCRSRPPTSSLRCVVTPDKEGLRQQQGVAGSRRSRQGGRTPRQQRPLKVCYH